MELIVAGASRLVNVRFRLYAYTLFHCIIQPVQKRSIFGWPGSTMCWSLCGRWWPAMSP